MFAAGMRVDSSHSLFREVINDLIQPAVLVISRINKNIQSHTLITLLEKESMYDKSKMVYRQRECANFGKGE